MRLYAATVLVLLALPLLAIFPLVAALVWAAGVDRPFLYTRNTLLSLPAGLIHMRHANDHADALRGAARENRAPHKPPVCIECGRMADEAWAKVGGSWHPGPLPTLGICGVCFHQAIAVAEAKGADG